MSPGLDARAFHEVLQHTLNSARDNLDRDGYVATAMLMYTSTGDLAATVLETAGPPTAADVAEARGTGVTLLPSPLRDQVPELQWIARSTKAASVLFVGEFWSLPEDTTRTPAQLIDAVPSEQPDRVEGVVVAGSWPAQQYLGVMTRQIVRDKRGRPRLSAWKQRARNESIQAPWTEPFTATGGDMLMTTWIEEIIPPTPL